MPDANTRPLNTDTLHAAAMSCSILRYVGFYEYRHLFKNLKVADLPAIKDDADVVQRSYTSAR